MHSFIDWVDGDPSREPPQQVSPQCNPPTPRQHLPPFLARDPRHAIHQTPVRLVLRDEADDVLASLGEEGDGLLGCGGLEVLLGLGGGVRRRVRALEGEAGRDDFKGGEQGGREGLELGEEGEKEA